MKPISLFTPPMMAFLLLVLYAPALNWLVIYWWQHADSFIGMVAVPIAAALMYKRWQVVGRSGLPNTNLGWLWLLVFAVVLCLTGYALTNMLLACLSFPLLLYAAIAVIWGGQYARNFRFPIAFLFFAIPVFDLLEIYFSFPMRLGSTALASYILMPFMTVSFAGTQLITPALEVAVVESCSGLNYLNTLLMLGVFLSWQTLVRGRDRLLLVMAIPLIVLIANAVRIAVIGMLGSLFGRDVAIGFFHDFSGLFLFALAVVGTIALSGLIERLITPDSL